MFSPFTSKLGSNYRALDPDEIFTIQALLVEPISRLQRLNKQIADLHKAIAELAEERTRVREFVDAHKALISPIRRIPPELLQEIFVACLPPYRNCAMSASEAPVLLGRVCNGWRKHSLSTPRLWASLHIPEPPLRESVTALLSIRERKFAQRMEIAKAWLERSGQCPLSISLYGSPPPNTVLAGYSGTSVMLQALVPFASRWYDIHITATSAALESLCVLSENDVPMLRTLDIKESFQSPLPPSPRWGSFGLLHGPKISSFVIFRTSSEPLNFPLRWHQLTSLSIANRFTLGPPLTSTMAAGMFSRCPRLRTCRLVINDDTDSAAVPPPRESVLELPSLLALDIHSIGVPVNRTGGLFSRISLPQAGHLSLQGFIVPHDPDTFTYFHFPTIIPRLESLVLETHLFSKPALVDLLRGLPPTIRELQLTGRDDYPSLLDDDALAALTPSPDRHPFGCLNLQRLELLYCRDVSDQALLRFIQARMGSSTREDQPATLRHVEARFVREMQLDIGPEIQPFLDAGLRFDTTHAPAPELTWRLSPWLGQNVSEELPT